MFNAHYAYANAYYPKAFYAQPRRNFRKMGHIGGNFSNVSGGSHAFGRGNIIHPQRMFNGHFRGGYGIWQSFGQNSLHTFQTPRNPFLFAISRSAKVNGSQGSSSNIKELIC